VIRESLRQTFNTATVQFALSGAFEPVPIGRAELETFLASGFKLPAVDIPAPLRPFAERWWKELREELEPLVGKPIDPRFVNSVLVKQAG
jgi:hypothetical protein